MKNTHNFLRTGRCLTVLLMFSMTAGLLSAQPFQIAADDSPFFKDIPENFKSQIKLAIPPEAIVKPTEKRKLLVVNINIRDKKMTSLHASVPYANYAIYCMGIQAGAFETYFTNDTLAFTRDILQQFDGIVLNNTVGVLFENMDMRQALLDYVYGGGGIMGIHGGAGATFVQYPVYDQFPEFGEMMGGYENGGHPWKTHEFINMIVDEPGHPINLGFEVKDFDISDEIYQYTDPYSRDHVRVLLSVNKEKTDMSDSRRFLPERKMDGDFPVSWVRSYGKGRVFNTSLGHHPHINWDLRILNHNFRAIQYILGDLPAPAAPNNKLTASILSQEKLGWRLGLTAWTFKDLTLMETIDKAAELGIWYLDGLNVQKVSADINKNFDYNLSTEELLTVRRKLLEKGVAMTNYYIHDIPADEKVCEQIFEFGRLMGIEAFIAEPKPEALPMIDEYCQKYRIKLAIHNHGADISPVYWDPKKLLKSIENRSSWIGACADIGYWQRNGIDPIAAIKLLDKRLITIQVHDLNIVSKEGHDVAWGTGKSNLKEVFELLAGKGLKPTLIGLEYSYNWGNSLPDIQREQAIFRPNCNQYSRQ
jgi:type 1 glutamine amidotransferase/sugar phosphate isomerase/epimerase